MFLNQSVASDVFQKSPSTLAHLSENLKIPVKLLLKFKNNPNKKECGYVLKNCTRTRVSTTLPHMRGAKYPTRQP